MTKQDIDILAEAFKGNLDRTPDTEHKEAIAAVATAIDYLQENIIGLAEKDKGAFHPASPSPNPNEDPNPIATETMRKLGSLGMQRLDELKGYKYDDNGHILLHIKGRFANTGWIHPDPHLEELKMIMSAYGNTAFREMA